MKKIILNIMLAGTLLFMASCKKNVEQIVPGGDDSTLVTLMAGHDNGDRTIIGQYDNMLPVYWSDGDKLYIVGATQGYLGVLSITGYSENNPSNWALFKGSLNAVPTSGQTIHVYYVGKDQSISGGTSYPLTTSSQEGTLEDIAKNMHVMHGEVTADGTKNLGSVTMQNMIAVARFDISGYEGDAKCTGVYTSATIDLKTGTLTPSGSTGTVTFSRTKSNCYMALIPGSQTFNFSKNDGTLPVSKGTHTIAARKFYSNNGNSIIVLSKNYVDLGLDSGVLWGTTNIGASAQEDYGSYFAWGETDDKADYTWATYKWSTGTMFDLTKYNTADSKKVLDEEDDAASMNCGNIWRMPTQAEWEELLANTTRHTETYNGKTGLRLYSTKTGYTSNSIFLPFAGYVTGSTPTDTDTEGIYWSGSLSTAASYSVFLKINGTDAPMVASRERMHGCTIRPVIDNEANTGTTGSFDPANW